MHLRLILYQPFAGSLRLSLLLRLCLLQTPTLYFHHSQSLALSTISADIVSVASATSVSASATESSFAYSTHHISPSLIDPTTSTYAPSGARSVISFELAPAFTTDWANILSVAPTPTLYFESVSSPISKSTLNVASKESSSLSSNSSLSPVSELSSPSEFRFASSTDSPPVLAMNYTSIPLTTCMPATSTDATFTSSSLSVLPSVMELTYVSSAEIKFPIFSELLSHTFNYSNPVISFNATPFISTGATAVTSIMSTIVSFSENLALSNEIRTSSIEFLTSLSTHSVKAMLTTYINVLFTETAVASSSKKKTPFSFKSTNTLHRKSVTDTNTRSTILLYINCLNCSSDSVSVGSTEIANLMPTETLTASSALSTGSLNKSSIDSLITSFHESTTELSIMSASVPPLEYIDPMSIKSISTASVESTDTLSRNSSYYADAVNSPTIDLSLTLQPIASLLTEAVASHYTKQQIPTLFTACKTLSYSEVAVAQSSDSLTTLASMSPALHISEYTEILSLEPTTVLFSNFEMESSIQSSTALSTPTLSLSLPNEPATTALLNKSASPLPSASTINLFTELVTILSNDSTSSLSTKLTSTLFSGSETESADEIQLSVESSPTLPSLPLITFINGSISALSSETSAALSSNSTYLLAVQPSSSLVSELTSTSHISSTVKLSAVAISFQSTTGLLSDYVSALFSEPEETSFTEFLLVSVTDTITEHTSAYPKETLVMSSTDSDILSSNELTLVSELEKTPLLSSSSIIASTTSFLNNSSSDSVSHGSSNATSAAVTLNEYSFETVSRNHGSNTATVFFTSHDSSIPTSSSAIIESNASFSIIMNIESSIFTSDSATPDPITTTSAYAWSKLVISSYATATPDLNSPINTTTTHSLIASDKAPGIVNSIEPIAAPVTPNYDVSSIAYLALRPSVSPTDSSVPNVNDITSDFASISVYHDLNSSSVFISSHSPNVSSPTFVLPDYVLSTAVYSGPDTNASKNVTSNSNTIVSPSESNSSSKNSVASLTISTIHGSDVLTAAVTSASNSVTTVSASLFPYPSKSSPINPKPTALVMTSSTSNFNPNTSTTFVLASDLNSFTSSAAHVDINATLAASTVLSTHAFSTVSVLPDHNTYSNAYINPASNTSTTILMQFDPISLTDALIFPDASANISSNNSPTGAMLHSTAEYSIPYNATTTTTTPTVTTADPVHTSGEPPSVLTVGLTVAGTFGIGILVYLAVVGLGGGGAGRRRSGKQLSMKKTYDNEGNNHFSGRIMSSKCISKLGRPEVWRACSLRWMCELASVEEVDEGLIDLAVLNWLGPLVKPGDGILPSAILQDMRSAIQLGKKKEDCSLTYHFCSFSGADVLDSIVSYFSVR
ncbi:hypothetical protein SK128_006590 [Halocaridina rubra]|uniref:Uncharacterized protein n=1 Tax=Halocaridina rubra TaxID=373956 RepID=A0AAN8XH90_HALRR